MLQFEVGLGLGSFFGHSVMRSKKMPFCSKDSGGQFFSDTSPSGNNELIWQTFLHMSHSDKYNVGINIGMS